MSSVLMHSISTRLRSERPDAPTQFETSALQQIGEDGIIQQEQLLLMKLEGNMAIAQVIDGLHQLQWSRGLHPQQRLGCRCHLHPRDSISITELISGLERLVPRQLQQHLPAADRAATTSQHRSFISRQG